MTKSFFCLLFTCIIQNPSFSQNIILEGLLTGIADGQYVYLTPIAWNSDKAITDSAIVRKESFRFALTIPEGSGNGYLFSTVRFAQHSTKDTAVTGTMVKEYFRRQLIYLEKGHAFVKGDAARLDQATWSGDPYITDLNLYFMNVQGDANWQQVSEKILSSPLGPELISKDMLYQFFALQYLRYQKAKSWIPRHPDSPASLLALYYDLGMAPKAEREQLYAQLTTAATNNEIGKHLQGFWDKH